MRAEATFFVTRGAAGARPRGPDRTPLRRARGGAGVVVAPMRPAGAGGGFRVDTAFPVPPRAARPPAPPSWSRSWRGAAAALAAAAGQGAATARATRAGPTLCCDLRGAGGPAPWVAGCSPGGATGM